MLARRTLSALTLALATLSLTHAAAAQQAPAPAAASAPAPDNTLLAPVRIDAAAPPLALAAPDAQYWQTRATSMHLTLQLLEQGERDAQTSALATTLGMSAGAALSGGLMVATRSDIFSVVAGGTFLAMGLGMGIGAPVGYVLWNARRPQQSLLFQYQDAVRAQMPPELLVRNIESRWALRAGEQRSMRTLAAVLSGIVGVGGAGLGLYVIVDTSSFPSGSAGSLLPLALLLGTVSLTSLGAAIWIGITPSPTERSLEHWRAFGAPARARGIATLQPTALLTHEVRGVALTGVFF